MASRPRAADDFTTIKAARDKILKDEEAARSGKTTAATTPSSPSPQRPPCS